MSLPELFFRFMYIGLFTVGGGLAAIPLMQRELVFTGLIDEAFFYNMVAVSESTPGPIGVNLATYIGYTRFGFIGGVVSTMGIVIPCFAISLIVSVFFNKFAQTKVVKAAFYGIKACVCGLIATAAYKIIEITLIDLSRFQASGRPGDIFNYVAMGVFVALFALNRYWKKPPYVLIAISAALGVLLL